MGVRNQGLAFSFIPKNWPKWESYSKYGELMNEIQSFVDEEFKYVEVDDVMPITPTA